MWMIQLNQEIKRGLRDEEDSAMKRIAERKAELHYAERHRNIDAEREVVMEQLESVSLTEAITRDKECCLYLHRAGCYILLCVVITL